AGGGRGRGADQRAVGTALRVGRIDREGVLTRVGDRVAVGVGRALIDARVVGGREADSRGDVVDVHRERIRAIQEGAVLVDQVDRHVVVVRAVGVGVALGAGGR